MDSAKILHYWHLAGVGAAAVSVVAAELTPLVSMYPKAAAVVASINAVSLAVTVAMNKVANDKVVKAYILDPATSTVTGFGLPKEPTQEVPK